jgi:hypothetical protein
MQFDFNVGANQSQHIDVVGTFIKYKSGTGTIRVRLNGGGYIDLLPGQGVNNVNFTSVDVQDRTGAQNVGTILAGIYDFRDDRITGTVDVVDGGKARTMSNTACMGYAYIAAQAGLNANIQLWNPSTSALNLYVSQIVFYSNGTGGCVMGRFDAAIQTLVRNGARKRLSSAASVAEVRAASDVQKIVSQIGGLDKTLKFLKFSEPLLIEPGSGLVLATNSQNEDLGGTFEYFEEAR